LRIIISVKPVKEEGEVSEISGGIDVSLNSSHIENILLVINLEVKVITKESI
jgi:hypothetical protein